MRLKERNPGFDGKVNPTIANGVVTGLQFLTDDMDDISPVRAITSLRTLDIHGENRGKGRVADLSALKGLALTKLNCLGTRVADLSPLTGMPLQSLVIAGTEVSDLSPIRGMPLDYLNFADTEVSDLSPVAGMKLTRLVSFHTNVTDLSPLKGMGLENLHFDYHAERDFEVIQSLTALNIINGRPAPEFWKAEAAIRDWKGRIRGLSEDGQKKAIVASLKELNPEFEEQADSLCTFEKSVMTTLSIRTDHVSNVSFLRALPGLELLQLMKGKQIGKLADLTPLRELRLKHLDLDNNVVIDLTPLQGQPLGSLSLMGNPVSDLRPLRKALLNQLNLWFTQVDSSSLAALKGMMTLRTLNVGGTKVTDLSPIQELKLKTLYITMTEISDILPLDGMPLTNLWMERTRVEDLSPIKGMRLQLITFTGSPIRDISVLRGMPLEAVKCDFDPERDATVLRSIPTLKTINDQLAAEFWKEFDARQSRAVLR
jgi:Leucine-rich repeat (LRR) protein